MGVRDIQRNAASACRLDPNAAEIDLEAWEERGARDGRAFVRRDQTVLCAAPPTTPGSTALRLEHLVLVGEIPGGKPFEHAARVASLPHRWTPVRTARQHRQ